METNNLYTAAEIYDNIDSLTIKVIFTSTRSSTVGHSHIWCRRQQSDGKTLTERHLEQEKYVQ